MKETSKKIISLFHVNWVGDSGGGIEEIYATDIEEAIAKFYYHWGNKTQKTITHVSLIETYYSYLDCWIPNKNQYQ